MYGLAGADHTTLLLNCYTKLKDVDKLDAFIKRDSRELNSKRETSSAGTAGSPVSVAGGAAAAGMAVLAAAAKAARTQGAGAASAGMNCSCDPNGHCVWKGTKHHLLILLAS